MCTAGETLAASSFLFLPLHWTMSDGPDANGSLIGVHSHGSIRATSAWWTERVTWIIVDPPANGSCSGDDPTASPLPPHAPTLHVQIDKSTHGWRHDSITQTNGWLECATWSRGDALQPRSDVSTISVGQSARQTLRPPALRSDPHTACRVSSRACTSRTRRVGWWRAEWRRFAAVLRHAQLARRRDEGRRACRPPLTVLSFTRVSHCDCPSAQLSSHTFFPFFIHTVTT